MAYNAGVWSPRWSSRHELVFGALLNARCHPRNNNSSLVHLLHSLLVWEPVHPEHWNWCWGRETGGLCRELEYSGERTHRSLHFWSEVSSGSGNPQGDSEIDAYSLPMRQIKHKGKWIINLLNFVESSKNPILAILVNVKNHASHINTLHYKTILILQRKRKRRLNSMCIFWMVHRMGVGTY